MSVRLSNTLINDNFPYSFLYFFSKNPYTFIYLQSEKKVPLSGWSPFPTWGPSLESPGNLSGPISIFLNAFFADYTVITDMVLGQCFHRIIRFKNLVFKANKNRLLLKNFYHQKHLPGPVSYRVFRETGPWSG